MLVFPCALINQISCKQKLGLWTEVKTLKLIKTETCVSVWERFDLNMEMACVGDDWEHHVVNPLLQDMHCGDEEYFNTQDVSSETNLNFFLFIFKTKSFWFPFLLPKCSNWNCG